MIWRLAALLLLPLPTLAQAWTVDPAASRLTFEATQTETPFTGRFARWQAEIAFDPDAPDEASITVTVDLASVEAGDVQRNQALPQPIWLDIASHPTAIWRASGAEALADGSYRSEGSLSLKGTERPVPVVFSLEIAEDGSAKAVGETQLDRTDFAVGTGEWDSGQWVSKTVTVRFDLRATPAE